MAGSCHICGSADSKYSCPKCNIFYCSLACYQSQKHADCSEAFYEKCVKEQLQNCESDPEVTRKMIEILRLQNEEESDLDSDDEDIPDLAIRLDQVNLDDEEAIWEKLTAEEKLEFRKLVSTGSIIKILPEAEPWWKVKKRKTLIQECEKENSDWRNCSPPVPGDIVHISKLSKTEPSPNILFMILNVLYSYIFTVRWFKGSHTDMPVEAISTCLALSATLRSNTVFKNSIEALIAVEDDLQRCEWIPDKCYDKDLIKDDLTDIIHGSYNEDLYYCIKCTFSDIANMCSQAVFTLKNCKTNHLKRFSGPPPTIQQLQLVSKKMTYYLSWTQTYGKSLINIF